MPESKTMLLTEWYVYFKPVNGQTYKSCVRYPGAKNNDDRCRIFWRWIGAM